jgi:hypothetical protein
MEGMKPSKKIEGPPDVLSACAVARLRNVSHDQVCRAIRDKKLRATRVLTGSRWVYLVRIEDARAWHPRGRGRPFCVKRTRNHGKNRAEKNRGKGS